MLPRLKKLLGCLSLGICAACAAPPAEQGINDPHEERNRKVHAFNKNIDQRFLRPAANGYGNSIPRPVQRGIGNFAGNVATPGHFVNDVLQANLDDAAHNFTRFLINTTIGIGGIFDPATDMGLLARESDFGETLFRWGVREGPYVEIPFSGPSTRRAAVGKVVDLFTNPLSYVAQTPERYAIPVSGGLSGLGQRFELGDVIDDILHESADSYSQARLLYLENRRFTLSGSGTMTEVGIDPYEAFDDAQ